MTTPTPYPTATRPPKTLLGQFFSRLSTFATGVDGRPALLGFLGDPSYGGNRDHVGWRHIGFDDRMAFTPPFGFYDAETGKGGPA